jgi:hypothetical protein
VKGGGAAIRERESLQRALAEMAFHCPDCARHDGKIEWCAGNRRYRVVVYHDPSCPAMRSSTLRKAVDRYIRDGLIATGGYYSADYNDHDVVGLHRPNYYRL